MCTGGEWVGGGILEEGPSREESGQDQGRGLCGLMRLGGRGSCMGKGKGYSGEGRWAWCVDHPEDSGMGVCVCCIRHWGAMAGS